ncbi:MAG: hypothetical protein IT580_15390 [Verrucomicrobiales bacterium]|nr:hypothetical protein [Verrucomicrobiales bacterium]
MIVAFESIKRAGEILKEIEALQAELAGLFSSKGSTAAAAAPKRRGRPPGSGVGKRRKMSAEGRARIAAAAKARWAKFHADKAKSGKK